VRRIAVEIPIAVAAAAMIAGLVLAAGTAIQPPTAPGSQVAQSVEPSDATERICLDAPVTSHTAPGIDGEAELCSAGRDVRVRLRVNGVTAGKVYTAWLSYVEQPLLCRDAPCGPSDFFADVPLGLLAQFDGGVAPPSRTLELAGELHDLQLASGAQVTLLLLRPRGPTGLHSQAVFIIP
jgi:hypothetical protein